MAGYTPVFDSIFTGTLCGKYPDTAAWLYFLALADKHGLVDMTPHYISSVTGMPEDELVGCIERFMQPDPYSRTADEDGRRLALIDPERAWGWRIVNHGKYREKARLQAKSAREVEEGKNAERIRDRRRPPMTAADPLSNTNTNTNTNAEKSNMGGKPPASDPDEFTELRKIYPKRSGDHRWKKALEHCRARLKEGHTWDEILDGARRYAGWCKATDKIGTETVKQAATFVGTEKGFLEPWLLPKRQLSPIERVLNPEKADDRLVN